MAGPRLYVLSHGFIENDVAINLQLHAHGTADNPNRPAEWHRVPSICLLLEHPRLGWVLFDTGSHDEAMNGRWPETSRQDAPLFRTPEDMLPARLAQLGLKPADIDWLVLTHLHLDHAGGLYHFAHTKAGSRVIVHEQELRQGLFELFVRNTMQSGPYLREDFVGLDGIAYEPVAGDTLLADDVELLWLPGHSAGMMGVRLSLPNAGNIIYASDAAYNRLNYGPPIIMPGLVYDTVACRHSLERLRWMERRYNAQVWFGHDMQQFEEFRLSPEYYD